MAIRGTGHRKCSYISIHGHTLQARRQAKAYKRARTDNPIRGYVALAVATEQGTHTKEVETGLGGDREENMIAFSVEALKLLKEVMKGEAKL